MDKIVANLCRNHDFIPLIRKRFRDQFFAQPVSVSVGCVEKCYAQIKGLMHERDRFALGEISPPTGGNRPQPKANFAHRQVRASIRTKAHDERITTEATEVTERIWRRCRRGAACSPPSRRFGRSSPFSVVSLFSVVNSGVARKTDTALLIVAHGSTVNPDSSAPTLAHA